MIDLPPFLGPLGVRLGCQFIDGNHTKVLAKSVGYFGNALKYFQSHKTRLLGI